MRLQDAGPIRSEGGGWKLLVEVLSLFICYRGRMERKSLRNVCFLGFLSQSFNVVQHRIDIYFGMLRFWK